MSAPRPDLGAVVPALEAAPTVAEVVRRTLELVDRVVVVDDGSRDGTGEAAARAGADVRTHAENRGKGAALRTGMEALFEGGVPYVATIDADGQHLPEELPVLTATLARSPDLVLGVRSHLFQWMSPVRRTSNRVSSRLISFAAGERLSDVQTGFRLYSRRLFEEVGLPEDGFEAESAVVVRACRRGYRVLAVPVEMGLVDGRCTSHYRPLLDSLRIARAVVGARLERVGA